MITAGEAATYAGVIVVIIIIVVAAVLWKRGKKKTKQQLGFFLVFQSETAIKASSSFFVSG